MTQGSLFERGEWWENEWQGMPEFRQDDLRPHQQVVKDGIAVREGSDEYGMKLVQLSCDPIPAAKR